jgi:drug/metabolite transporter (DMT)-like permease
MLFILVCVCLSVAGQVMLKKGMLEVGRFQGFKIIPFFFEAFTNSWIIIAILLYVGSLASWLIVLSRERLSFAYLFLGLIYVFIPIASWRFLGERLTVGQIIGMVLITIGVVIVGSGK